MVRGSILNASMIIGVRCSCLSCSSSCPLIRPYGRRAARGREDARTPAPAALLPVLLPTVLGVLLLYAHYALVRTTWLVSVEDIEKTCINVEKKCVAPQQSISLMITQPALLSSELARSQPPAGERCSHHILHTTAVPTGVHVQYC